MTENNFVKQKNTSEIDVFNNSIFMQFSSQFLFGMSERMRETYSESELQDFLKERFLFFKEAVRRSGMVRVKALKSTTVSVDNTNLNGYVIVEIVSPDAPFIVVTVESLLRQLDLLIHRKHHPIMGADITTEKEVTAVKSPQENSEKYDYIYLEIEADNDSVSLKNIETAIAGHMLAVQLVQNQRQKMLLRLDSMVKEIGSITAVSAETNAEWVKLCGWLKFDNFTIMGFATFAEAAQTKTDCTNMLENSGLGILSAAYLKQTDGRLLNVLSTHLCKRCKSTFPFALDRIRFISPVLRFENLMILSIRVPDKQNGMLEHVFLGLIRGSSLHAKNTETPLVRQKMNYIFDNQNMLRNSYDYNEVVRIFSATPKSELFRSSRKEMLQVCEHLLSVNNPNNIFCFKINTRVSDLLKLMVVMPTSLFSEEAIEKTVAFLKEKIPHLHCDWFEARGSEKSRLHIEFEIPEEVVEKGDIPKTDLLQFENTISSLIKPWEMQLNELLRSHYTVVDAKQLYERYVPMLPSHYRARVDTLEALENIQYLELLTQEENIQFDLKEFSLPSLLGKIVSVLYVYSKNKIHLIEIMPILQNLGLHVIDQLTTRIGDDQKTLGFIQSFRVERNDHVNIDEQQYKPLLEAIVQQVFLKNTENDPLNGLALRAKLAWREINVLQLYRNLSLQLNAPLTRETINAVLLRHPNCSRLLFETFACRFSVDSTLGDLSNRQEVLLPQKKQEFLESLEQVQQVTDDEVLRLMFELIENTLRTNYYIEKNSLKTGISVKLDSRKIEQMPVPVPFKEIYVHDVGMEGLHLRFGPVARGGLRWSDRPDDFRTEILGLVKTQQTKNVVIVPVGSKGGFVLKNAPVEREEVIAESKYQYRRFISAMLDITDNMDAQGHILTPENVLSYDDPDPYLVVAADKGTASFSDIANEVSENYDYWLGDAFASGGSVGFDHKKEGITARGAWECVKLHFKEIGRNIQTEETTVMGIGDLSGDVFGNGMLLSKMLLLQAAFNHMHIFLDPNPNPHKSWLERKRIYDLPRSSWLDYSTELISKGGGVYERYAKSIKLSPEAKDLLGTTEDNLKGEDVVRLILKMKVDLFWLGGIGTYIKTPAQTHFQVGDQANNSIRIDTTECGMKVIGEGANLGLTQLARIDLANSGIRLNTDAIDNSAGVNMSDYEVNLKILLQQFLREKMIKSREERNTLLVSATDEVSELVLANNRGQHRAVSMDSMRSNQNLRLFRKLIAHLQDRGLNKRSEYIPSRSELDQLEQAKMPLPRPVLSVLMAYAKMEIFEALTSSSMPLENELNATYLDYVPQTLRKHFGERINEHPLKKEIVATVLTNNVTNQAGATFVSRMNQVTERSIPDIIRTYLIMESSLGAVEIRQTLSKMQKISEQERYETLIKLEDVLKMLVRNILQSDEKTPGFEKIEEYHELLSELIKHPENAVDPTGSSEIQVETDTVKTENETEGLDELSTVKEIGASLQRLRIAPDVMHLSLNKKMGISAAYTIAECVEQKFGLDWLRERLIELEPKNDWELEYQDILLRSLDANKLLVLEVLLAAHKIETMKEKDFPSLLEPLEAMNAAHLRAYLIALEQVRAGSIISLTSIAVILSHLNFIQNFSSN
ncbi:MAG: NAD-glutamate dehydrogenase [SAR324 cluster bacterium]|nr:NAD-glutamate dehydrogenase [SAR324 cluster bacterium]MBL7035652.1 NAD-glutamate dehydrogenase [SAR324 cluster bacterium]